MRTYGKTKYHRYVIDSELVKQQDDNLDSSYYLKKRKVSKWLFHYKSQWIFVWDVTIIVLAIINCFFVPLELAVETDFSRSFAYKAVNIAMDIIFTLDIFVKFNTSLEENSIEICDRVLISRKYISGQFTIDFLSVLPVDMIAALADPDISDRLKAISLLKLVRMLRLNKFLRISKV